MEWLLVAPCGSGDLWNLDKDRADARALAATRTQERWTGDATIISSIPKTAGGEDARDAATAVDGVPRGHGEAFWGKCACGPGASEAPFALTYAVMSVWSLP